MINEYLLLLIVVYGLCLASTIWFYQKRIKELTWENYNLSIELLEKKLKEVKLKTIMIISNEIKENFFITLEKIERELFNNNPQNPENKD